MIDLRERDILRVLGAIGTASRWELHERTGYTPNRVGQIVDGLIRKRLVRELDPEPLRAGRPRVPIEIDPVGRHIIGISLTPVGLSACRMGLTGDLIEKLEVPTDIEPARLVRAAAGVITRDLNPQTISVAVTMTGLIDPALRTLLLSSATPGQRGVSLAPLERAVNKIPLVLGNVMQALAARWVQSQPADAAEDVLLVWFDDGRIGSAYLAGGKPCRGVLAGANELGHTRLAVETDRCFCGQVGCLERIFSTGFLRHRQRGGAALAPRVERFAADDSALHEMIGHFCSGLANAVNLLRPHRLVLVSPLSTNAAFCKTVVERVRENFLSPLQSRVAVEFWNQPSDEFAQNAAWLALAQLLYTGWDTTIPAESAAAHV